MHFRLQLSESRCSRCMIQRPGLFGGMENSSTFSEDVSSSLRFPLPQAEASCYEGRSQRGPVSNKLAVYADKENAPG